MSDDEPIHRRRATDGVTITSADMYALLVKMDHTLTRLDTAVTAQAATLADHETRIRQVESDGLNEKRVEAMETNVQAIRDELESMKRKLYAIPSAASAVAVAALVITLVRWL